MKTLNYSITIQAPVSKVRKIMFNHPTYEKRTEPFAAGSTYEWSWEEWSDIKFIDPKWYGMIAKIAKNNEHQYLSIQHLGEIGKDNKITMYPGESFENYTFTAIDANTTKLDIEMIGLPEDYIPMFDKLRPKALQVLKELCE